MRTERIRRIRTRLTRELKTPMPLRGETTALALMALTVGRAPAVPYSGIAEYVVKTINETFGAATEPGRQRPRARTRAALARKPRTDHDRQRPRQMGSAPGAVRVDGVETARTDRR